MKVYDETLARAIFEMHELRSDIRSHLAAGKGIPDSKHGEFESVIAEVIDELRPHVVGGDVSELAALWEKYNVEYIARFDARTTVREETTTGGYGITQTNQEVEISRVDMQVLMKVSQLLDRIAKELGLMPDTDKASRSGGKIS